jgi:hemolysin activation/secretion protein
VDGYLTGRLRLEPGDLVELGRLEDALVRFNRTSDVQLRAELKPGEEFATTDLYVAVTEPPRWEVRATLDNTGTPSTGRTRAGLAYENRSLLGYRDDISVSTTHADGQASDAISYGVPINTWGGRLNYAFSQDRTAIVHGPLASLNIKGESAAHILSLRQPTYVSERWQLDVLAGGKSRYTSNWIDTVFLQRTDTSDRSLGAELQNFDAKTYWAVNYTHYRGQASTTVDNTVYSIDRGNARYNRELPGPFTLRASFSWQATRHPNLPSSELFFIGGEGTVRGYDTGTLSGDHGWFGNVELHRPLDLGIADVGASAFLFGDYGNVTPFRPPNSTLPGHQHLTSLGTGANVALGRSLFGRITLGYGLTDVPGRPHPYALTFQLVATYF